MQIGIRDNLLDGAIGEKLVQATQLGFDGVEFLIGDDYQDNLLWQRGGVKQLKQFATAAGIAIASLSPGGFSNRSFIVEEPLRSEGIEMLRVCARAAKELGANVILVPFFGNYKLSSGHVDAPVVMNGLQSLDSIARECEVVWAVESTLSAEEHLTLIRNAGSDRVRVYYDVANATSLGYEAPAEIRSLGKHIAMIHMKDTDGKQLGEGRVPFDECFAAIRDIGYNDWLVLETPRGDDALNSAKRNLNFVREYLS